MCVAVHVTVCCVWLWCVLVLQGLLLCQHRRDVSQNHTKCMLVIYPTSQCMQKIKSGKIWYFYHMLYKAKGGLVAKGKKKYVSEITAIVWGSSHWLLMRELIGLLQHTQRMLLCLCGGWTDGCVDKQMTEWMMDRFTIRCMSSFFCHVIFVNALTDCDAGSVCYTWNTCCADSCLFTSYLHLTQDIWATVNP